MPLDDLWTGAETVADFIEALSKFPPDWPVKVAVAGNGGIAIEHREVRRKPVVAIFNKNGGRFGENPLTEEEYKRQSARWIDGLKNGQVYTSIHGDHRLYHPMFGENASCYGEPFDSRIIERMVAEGLIDASSVDIDRVRYLERS